MKITKGVWEGWTIDTDTRVIVYGDRYPVDMEMVLSTGNVLDKVFQIAGKPWATPEVIGGFVLAVAALYGGVAQAQYMLAPSGQSRVHDGTVLDVLVSNLSEKWMSGG